MYIYQILFVVTCELPLVCLIYLFMYVNLFDIDNPLTVYLSFKDEFEFKLLKSLVEFIQLVS